MARSTVNIKFWQKCNLTFKSCSEVVKKKTKGQQQKLETKKSSCFAFKSLVSKRVTKVLRRKSDRVNDLDEGKVEDCGNILGKKQEH